MSKQPMVDVAYDILKSKKQQLVFFELWNQVADIKNLSTNQREDDIAEFFNDLSLDDRFVNIGQNKWDLSERHRLDDIKKAKKDDLIGDDDDNDLDIDLEEIE